jgi:hypothetical protein
MGMTKKAEFENYIAALPWTRDQLAPKDFRRWVASREEAGREIDIETCELGSWYARDFDPYGADPDLPEEWRSPVSCVRK